MDELGRKIGILDQALSDASIYWDEPLKAADFTRLRAKLQSELEETETRWLESHNT
jgi:hypothetical protein